MRYLSPPLFPVHLRDLACDLFLHEVPCGDFEAGEFRVSSAFVCHPDPTVGYRIATPQAPAQSGRGQAPAQSGRPPAYAEGRWQATLAYLPDHEPALGARKFPLNKEWTSGYALAAGVDLLIHDAQYTQEEYAERIGFGHSSLSQAFEFAALAEVKHFVPFHHDPAHTDDDLDRLMDETIASARPRFAVTPGTEGATFVLN
jgi:ribonuclease BN (tRNA processing enzyme)